MATAPKKATEMTDEEYRTARAELKSGGKTERQPNTHMLFADVAATIKGWTPVEMRAFSETFGISIVCQDIKKMRRFHEMTAEEKQAFIALHGLQHSALAKETAKGKL